MRQPLRFLLFVALILCLLVAGCAAAPQRAPSSDNSKAVPPASSPRAPAQPETSSGDYDVSDADRLIILTTNLQLTVEKTEEAVTSIKSLTATRGGYVTLATVWHDGDVVRAQLSVRVPAEGLEPFLAEVRVLAKTVNREESSGEDVTEEYVDLEARLRNLQATETELRELLTTVRQKTGNAEEIMAVYRELTNIRGQIEQIQGRKQYLDRLVALATVNINLNEEMVVAIGSTVWQPSRTVRQALNALVETAKFGVNAFIWVVLFLVPLLAVPAFVVWLILYLMRRRRRGA